MGNTAEMAVSPAKTKTSECVKACSGEVILFSSPANDSGEALYQVNELLKSKVHKAIKETFDRVASFLILAFLSPFLPFFILAVRADGGPAFYSQMRVGKDGKMFRCWKFRSMVVNADEVLQEFLKQNESARREWEHYKKLKENDPRVTKIGGFIRKFSIDELPQLYNVLRGDMSLVGPRPILESEKELYGEKLHAYLLVKPGITGLWQVSGRNETTYAQRVEFDHSYIQNWSLLNDVIILFKTVHVVFSARGAH